MEMIPMLKQLSMPHDIFVTCPQSLYDEVGALLGTLGAGSLCVEAVVNRGRDVAAFLFIMTAVDASEYDVVLKLHTKKSSHHPDGGSWCKDILGKLLDQEWTRAALGELRSGGGFGILGPEGSVVSMEYYGGGNLERVLHLAAMMGFVPLPGNADVFVAGTMFYARIDALRPLLEIGLTFGDFEPETGQTDGALAHVIERAVSYSALVAGYRVGELALTRDGMIARVPDAGQARLRLVDHL
jgi:lipopolysaccharide biosynthesis protein